MKRNVEKNIREGKDLATQAILLEMQIPEAMEIVDRNGAKWLVSNELYNSMYDAYHLGLMVGYRRGRKDAREKKTKV